MITEYHRNKRPDKTYVSKSLSFGQQSDRRFRIATKVFDSPETHSFALEHGEQPNPLLQARPKRARS